MSHTNFDGTVSAAGASHTPLSSLHSATSKLDNKDIFAQHIRHLQSYLYKQEALEVCTVSHITHGPVCNVIDVW